MTQAARSGKANIVEGSARTATSKEMEMKLTDVARASLNELASDYEDWLLKQGLVPCGGLITNADCFLNYAQLFPNWTYINRFEYLFRLC
jgi:hypothetical protein